jgi:hypothetical protein
MSADIEKLAVFDDRIVQTRPKYAVEKGALSLTNSPFNAIAQTASQHTYNIYVPSENVYVDRAMDWSATMFLRIDVQLSDTAGGQYPVGQPLFQLGVDGSLAAFPLNACCSTMTATINDTTVVINSQDVLTEVLRLTDYKKNRLQRTCPTMLDKYQSNADALNATNDPISGFTNMSHDYHEQPNGSYANIIFTAPDGTPLQQTGFVAGAYTFGGLSVDSQDGVPVSTDQGAGVVNGIYSAFVKIRTTEKLVLSPFIFAESFANDTGLFGINNIQLVMNMRDPNRAIRLRDSQVGTAVKQYYGSSTNPIQMTPPVSYNSSVSSGAFRDSVVNVQFLTPSLDIPLPPKSVVPYMEFPRYITQPQNSVLSQFGTTGDSAQLQSQTITLPQIPDLLIIYVKALRDPANNDKRLDPTLPQFGSGYLPIETSYDASRTTNPLSINFDNFSGLLSSHTTEQLYHMSVKNGLEMDWDTWSGLARVPTGEVGSRVPTVGGYLVLKPSTDITLQSGQAPSLVGNFTLQFNVRVRNTYPFSVVPQIYVITANSGFFESIRGSSRIIKGVLSEQDIIAAPLAPAGTREGLARMIGGNVLALANRLGMVKGMSGKKSEEKSEERGAGMGRSVGAGMGRKGLAARLM